MQCPNCSFQNPEKMKFCGGCGSKISVSCKKCGFENPEGFSFCGRCGNNLYAVDNAQGIKNSRNDKFSKIQTQFAEKIEKKINAQSLQIKGEYKQAAILFCDLENFTPLVESIGPEKDNLSIKSILYSR